MISLLHRLVRLLPSAFEKEFGAEMREQIARDYQAARAGGIFAAGHFAMATAIDIGMTAAAERWDPTMIHPHSPITEGQGMRRKLNDWKTDIGIAVRSLMRSPGFAMVTIGTLGLAIGANAGMFTVVETVMLRPLPHPAADRLVYIAGTAPGSEMAPEFGGSRELYLQYKERSKLLEDIALYSSFTSTMRADEHVERIRMSSPSASLFATLGVTPLIGRLPVAEDESRVALISYSLWQTWFGGDSSVIGKSYQISGDSRTIIGVLPAHFRFPTDETLVWFPTPVTLEGLVPGQFGVGLVGRMKPGTSISALTTELTGLAREAPARFGGSPSYTRLMTQHRTVVRPLDEQLLGSVSGPLWVLLGAVATVLLIACANVANLFMVRTEGRQRDLAVRRAIGAGRGELIRLQMAEALVVACFAGILAAVIARLALPVFLHAAPPGIPRIGDVHLGLMTLLFTAAAALLSALACGLLPAIKASEPDLSRLREGGRGSTRRRHLLRDGLVVAQTALALVLLIGSGLLIRSFKKLADVKPGYETSDVFTFQIAPERPTLTDGPSYAQFQMMFMDRLRALPGVQSVGFVDNVPLNEGTSSSRFAIEGGTDEGPLLSYTFAAGDYFKTMGIAVLQGHPFTDLEAITPGSVVISKTAANLLWPGLDPIGRRMHAGSDSTWDTVVGVVNDVRQNDFREEPQAIVYLPMVGPTPTSWRVSSPAYVVKTSRAETIAPDVRALVHEVAPEAPMYRVYTMAGLARDSMVGLSFTMLTLGIVSMLALILGTVGLYGVLSYVVAQRTREIGVRMALGAEAGQVRRMVVAQGARVVMLGVVIGVAVAFASTRALASLLFGVNAVDVTTFVAMSGLLVLVGLLASYIPARRASSVDPIASLRGD